MKKGGQGSTLKVRNLKSIFSCIQILQNIMISALGSKIGQIEGWNYLDAN